MITHSTTHDGYPKYEEDDYWIEMYKYNTAILYHTCERGADCYVLLADEVRYRRCNLCGTIKIPDDLWTLYVLLDGRGVN